MMPSDPIQAMEFAQSKGQARKDGKTGISFGDIAGLEATKDELREVVEVSQGYPACRGQGFDGQEEWLSGLRQQLAKLSYDLGITLSLAWAWLSARSLPAVTRMGCEHCQAEFLAKLWRNSNHVRC